MLLLKSICFWRIQNFVWLDFSSFSFYITPIKLFKLHYFVVVSNYGFQRKGEEILTGKRTNGKSATKMLIRNFHEAKLIYI